MGEQRPRPPVRQRLTQSKYKPFLDGTEGSEDQASSSVSLTVNCDGDKRYTIIASYRNTSSDSCEPDHPTPPADVNPSQESVRRPARPKPQPKPRKTIYRPRNVSVDPSAAQAPDDAGGGSASDDPLLNDNGPRSCGTSSPSELVPDPVIPGDDDPRAQTKLNQHLEDMNIVADRLEGVRVAEGLVSQGPVVNQVPLKDSGTPLSSEPSPFSSNDDLTAPIKPHRRKKIQRPKVPPPPPPTAPSNKQHPNDDESLEVKENQQQIQPAQVVPPVKQPPMRPAPPKFLTMKTLQVQPRPFSDAVSNSDRVTINREVFDRVQSLQPESIDNDDIYASIDEYSHDFDENINDKGPNTTSTPLRSATSSETEKDEPGEYTDMSSGSGTIVGSEVGQQGHGVYSDPWRPVQLTASDSYPSLNDFSPGHQHDYERDSNDGNDSVYVSANELDDEDSLYAVPSTIADYGSDISNDEASDSEEETKPDIPKKSKIFYIAEEIMTSEKVFVGVLKILNEDFRRAVEKANEFSLKPVIDDQQLNQILTYLPQLQDLNEGLLKDLELRIENWEKNPRLADIIMMKAPFLKMYSYYITHFEESTSLLSECCKKSQAFANVVEQFEKSPQCSGLALKHFMLKPIQRIPQYKLLLDDYFKHLPDGSEDYDDTKAALHIVTKVAEHANESMRQGEHFEKLMLLQQKIMGNHIIVQPGRVLIKEGTLNKVCRKELQPRHFVLLSDVLLYLTPFNTMFKLNNELSLSGMKLKKPDKEKEFYQNEFSLFSVQRSFNVSASSPLERDDWLDAIANAIRQLERRKHTFLSIVDNDAMSSDMYQASQADTTFVVGEMAPIWIPDAKVTMCMTCTSVFTLTWRRHHCRACGKIVCGNCSGNTAPLRYLAYKAQRVCVECYTTLSQSLMNDTTFDNDGMIAVLNRNTSAEKDEEDTPLPTISKNYLMTLFRSSGRKTKDKRKTSLNSKLREVPANAEGATTSGYLYLYMSRHWKRKWFVLRNKVLYTYKASEDIAATSTTPLLGYEVDSVNESHEGASAGQLFEIRHKGMAAMCFKAEDCDDANRWMEALTEATHLE